MLPLSVCYQRTVSRHEDVLSTVQLDLQQVSRGLGSGLEELEQLRKSVDAVIQEVSAVEALREHLGNKIGWNVFKCGTESMSVCTENTSF